MNKNSFTHKILPVIAIFMFVLFVLTTNCFASYTFTFSDNSNITLDSLPEGLLSDYVICKVSSSQYNNINYDYLLFTYNSSDGVVLMPNYNLPDVTSVSPTSPDFHFVVSLDDVCSYVTEGDKIKVYKYYSSTDTWEYVTSTASISYNVTLNSVYTTKDIYCFKPNDIRNLVGNLVFQAPVEEVAKQIFLAPVMTETTQEGTTLQEIMQTKTLQEIVEILPIVIPVVVGLIACLIGLRYLWRLLRKA